jgi:uroporphyrinogen III methyltransferase/synthase
MSGSVSLVGAGPGDPGLLTVAGRDRLAEADVVLYDRLANPALLGHCRPDAELIFAGKSPRNVAYTQDEINALLVEHGKAGKRVVRLKGGDPFVFGRGGEEALALAAAGVPYEVIPGVTSAIAAPAYAGVPVSHRGLASSFAVVTGQEDADKEDSSIDWDRLATAVDTVVILMGGAALPGVARALIRGGRDAKTPAVSVQWGTTTEQRSVAAPLERIADAVKEAGLGTPLLTVVGQVATLHDHIDWFENRPLFGKRVLVTRTRHQASAISDLLRREGAVPVELPTLELIPVATETELASMTQNLESNTYNWCLFASTNAVDFVFDHLEREGKDARIFAACRIAALGPATAASLHSRGLRADVTATDFRSEGLVASLGDANLKGARILLPHAADASPALVAGLKRLGAKVDEIVLYESRPPREPEPDALTQVRAGRIDAATFASSSSVRNLATLLGDDFARLRDAVVASIGPVTSHTARELGLTVAVEPSEATIPGLVEALKAYYAARKANA